MGVFTFIAKQAGGSWSAKASVSLGVCFLWVLATLTLVTQAASSC